MKIIGRPCATIPAPKLSIADRHAAEAVIQHFATGMEGRNYVGAAKFCSKEFGAYLLGLAMLAALKPLIDADARIGAKEKRSTSILSFAIYYQTG